MIEEEAEGILVMVVGAAFRHLKRVWTTSAHSPRHRTEGPHRRTRWPRAGLSNFSSRSACSPRRASDISSDELVNAYNRYCEFRGLEPLVAPNFQKYVISHMVRCHKSNKGTHCQREINGEMKRVNGYPNVTLIEDNGGGDFENDFPEFSEDPMK